MAWIVTTVGQVEKSFIIGDITSSGESEPNTCVVLTAPTAVQSFARSLGFKPGDSTVTFPLDNGGSVTISSYRDKERVKLDLYTKSGKLAFTGRYTWEDTTGTVPVANLTGIAGPTDNYGNLASSVTVSEWRYNSDVGLRTHGFFPGEPAKTIDFDKEDGIYISRSFNRPLSDAPEWEEFLNSSKNYEPDDPGGNSKPGGGSGSFDGGSDPIGFPGLPGLSAVSTGFVSLFAPTETQMNNFINYLWSDLFSFDTYKKIFANPMDAVIGLSIVPVDVPKGPARTIKVGGVDSGVAMTTAAKQYVTVSCGSVHVSEYWGSALDYAPYTKVSIFLPYIGTRELRTDDVMGKTISVQYNVDILSGGCAACIMCGSSVLYTFAGSCSVPVPVTSSNWAQTLTACIQLAGTGIAAVASGGSSLPANISEGVAMGAKSLSYSAGAVASAKPTVQRSGAISGSSGVLGHQSPYLIIDYPKQSLARNYNKLRGYPSNIYSKLGDLSGYTEVSEIHLKNIPALGEELEEIEKLLKEGVIL